jgi:hypothetical protein
MFAQTPPMHTVPWKERDFFRLSQKSNETDLDLPL